MHACMYTRLKGWKNREHRTLSRAIVGRKYANGHKSNDIINKTLTCPTTAL